MASRSTAYLGAFLTERDVVVGAISREPDGSYEVWAHGERVNVGAPSDPDAVVAWAHNAADAVVGRLGNRVLPW